MKKLSKQDFIDKSLKVHGDRYSYELVEYVNNSTKVKIICPVHGEFEQTPKNHYSYGCNKCGSQLSSDKQKKDLSYFIGNSKEIHDDKYDYSFVSGLIDDKVKIICPVHGEFEQKFGNHIYKKYGCPKCASHISRQEIELQEWLSSIAEVVTNNRSLISPLELDIVIPSHNIAIEYNGLYWHSESVGKDKRYHLNKYNLCKAEGCRLIQIWENEWMLKRDIVKSIIMSALGIYERKIHGRKCEMCDVSPKNAKIFYDANHIQGFQSGHHKGLMYEGELVSLMTIKFYDKFPVLERFVNKRNTLVYGAFSKILKLFDNINNLVTFSDPRYFTGNVYEKNGFEYQGMIKPNYWYFKNGSIDLFHRRRFQKISIKYQHESGILKNFDTNLTEYENMLINGYHRIWDSGNMKYILKR